MKSQKNKKTSPKPQCAYATKRIIIPRSQPKDVCVPFSRRRANTQKPPYVYICMQKKLVRTPLYGMYSRILGARVDCDLLPEPQNASCFENVVYLDAHYTSEHYVYGPIPSIMNCPDVFGDHECRLLFAGLGLREGANRSYLDPDD